MKTLISNGTVVTPEGTLRADLLMAEGRILAVGKNLAAGEGRDAAETVDATDRLVLPGGVDAHTHITLDVDAVLGTDAYYTGTLPALAGGTTTIVDHMAFAPEGRFAATQLALYHELADGRAAVDYAFHGVIQHRDENALRALETFRENGISSVKAYMTYAGRLDDAALLRFFRRCKELGLMALVHAEDHECVENGRAACIAEGRLAPLWHARSRPAECEAKAVARALALAAEAGDAPVYIVHLSTAQGLRAVQRARAAGQKNVFAETCPQYLCLTDACYQDPEEGLRYIMAPPLRSPEDVRALWAGLRDGDIQTVATDHCAFSLADKSRGRGDFTRCPGGAPGLEERFLLMFSEGVAKGRISLERFVELVCAGPARLMGLYPQKGALAPGSDADVVIVNPAARQRIRAAALHGPGDYSIYEGALVEGGIERVFLRGRTVYRDDRLADEPAIQGRFADGPSGQGRLTEGLAGQGRYIRRKPPPFE